MQPEHLPKRLRAEGTLTLAVKVTPRASVAEVIGEGDDGVLRVKVMAAADKGRANEQVCEVLARYFDVPKRNIEIVSGQTSRQKRVRITAK